MKTLTIAALAAVLMTGAAHAESLGEKTGANAVLGITPSTADFIQQAAQSDTFEIAASKLAEERGSETTKTFAKQMITDHGKTSEQLMAAVTAMPDARLPDAMSDAQKSMIEKLQGLNGKDFDEQYADDQEAGHKDAVSLFQRYADGGEDAKLKAWAGETLPALKHHLEMADKLDD